MGYIKKAYRELLQEIDCRYNYNIPYNWGEFAESISKKYHNLIIKEAKNKHICTNCKHEFETNKKINQREICPNCKNEYRIKRSNLKNYTFEDSLVMLDKVDDKFIIRLFDLRSTFKNDNANYDFEISSVEYARKIPFERDEIFINDRGSKNQGPLYIYHYCNPGKWRLYTRYYGLSTKGFIYTDNLEYILQDTDLKYSMLWDYAKHQEYIDIEVALETAEKNPEFELLVKAKLYNLATEAYEFTQSGKFEKVFEVPKTFYSFMKKHNITYKQLEILRILKEKDMKKIKYLEQYKNNSLLKEISKYISINKFIQYSKMKRRKVDLYMYRDYLKFASSLGVDLKDNKYVFPKNLKEEHDKFEKQYEIKHNAEINEAIIKRGKVLSMNSYKNSKYFITPAPSFESLIDESNQQKHCVRTYAEDYSNGYCDIYFMRDVKKPNKSLITIEVKGNEVRQKRGKHNCRPTEKEDKFLIEWENKIIRKAA